MERRATAVVVGACALLIAIAYANSLPVGFLFDDIYGIARNPSVRSLANIPRYFVDPFLLTTFRDNVDVRPLLQVTFALNYAISGYAPWSWHVFNLLVHLCCCALIYLIARDHLWLDDPRIAAAAALFFAVAPLNQQAIVYMWARSALLCTAFYLGAFHAHLRKRPALAALLLLCALLTKTIAVTLPLLIAAHALLARERPAWKQLALYCGVVAAFLVYRAAVLPGWADVTRHEKWVTPQVWLMSEWSAYLYYVRLWLWPNALSIDHDFAYNTTLLSARTLLSLGGILLWLGAALRFARRAPAFAFGTAWYFLTLAPESTLSPLAEVINDHRPYLGSALGLALLTAWALPRRALVPITAALCVAAVPLVMVRNYVWLDGARLWIDAAEKSPGNGRALMNAGRELMARGQLAPARAYFDKAEALVPNYSFLHINFSALASAEGRKDEAVREAQRAVELSPQLAPAWTQLGAALLLADRREESHSAYQRALELDPTLDEAREVLQQGGDEQALDMKEGLDALYKRGDARAAEGAFRKVLGLNPQHYGANYQLAVALDKEGRRAEALELWRKVLPLAEKYEDAQTAQTARARIAEGPGK